MKKGLSILLVLCAIMCMLLTGCGSSSVNLNDYVVITDEGYDGYGTISVKLDYEKLIEDHEDKLTDKNIDSSILKCFYILAYLFSFVNPLFITILCTFVPCNFKCTIIYSNNDKVL